jgi:hypothetical protein
MRYSCQLLARQNILLGKVPTTPTIASIIGGMESQEALKLIHDMPVEPGKVTHFNGLVNVMHTTAYVPREECESHWTYGKITELPARAERTTLADLLRIARSDLGADAYIELDQELITSLECPKCHTFEEVLKPLSDVTFEGGHCPTCGTLREAQFTHQITGEEKFLHRTLASVGVPPLHILRVNNGVEYRFYELTGDLPDALHFRHFENTEPLKIKAGEGRIRLKGDVVRPKEPAASKNPATGRIRLKEDGKAKKGLSLKSEGAQIQIKDKSYSALAITDPGQVRFREKKKLSQRVYLKPRRVRVCKI